MISVVIPLYNKEKSIVRTLDSVLAQTCTDYECVIVNDGSTDQSAQVVRDWIEEKGLRTEEKGCHFRLVNQENGGVSSARNKGIEEARGEYVAFLDGDDLWAPKYLEVIEALAKDYPEAVILGTRFATRMGEEVKKNENGLADDFRGIIDNVWDVGSPYWTSSTVLKKSEIEMFDERMSHGEDMDVWYRMMLKGKAAFDNRVLAYYCLDTENRAMERLIPLEKHIPYYIEKYQETRESNVAFRKYYDQEMIYRLYPYLLQKQYRAKAKKIARMYDYTLQKKSMRLRMQYPYLYNIYLKIKKIL